jgi:hypothetical protein
VYGATGATGPAGADGIAAVGGGSDKILILNDQVITTNYTIPTGKNAGTFGPISINNGISITIPTGTTWSVV